VSPRSYRRRRLSALLAGLGLLAVIAVVVVGASGSSSHSPRFVPPGGGATAPRIETGSLNVARGPNWQPAPAATRTANRLSLAGQVAQLFLVSVRGTGATAARGLTGSGWGGVVLDRTNYATPRQLRALTGALRPALTVNARIAPLIATGQEGGAATAFPGLPPRDEATLGAAGSAGAAAAQAALAAVRLRTLGVTMTLAPLADVDIPTGALTGRLFGSDPASVAQFTSEAVAGYARGGLIDAVSHFPGEGGASADPDQQAATVGGSLATLRSRDLVPFAAVASRAPVIQLSNAVYAAFDGVTPASLLPGVVALLRGPLHFQGVVLSGALEATLQPGGPDLGTVAAQAVSAGDDLLYVAGPPADQQAAYAGVLAAARRAPAMRDLVRQALLRDLTLKARYGLLTG
jgi:beta-N-acetylhexosaminidase